MLDSVRTTPLTCLRSRRSTSYFNPSLDEISFPGISMRTLSSGAGVAHQTGFISTEGSRELAVPPKKQSPQTALLGARDEWWEADSMGISESGLPTQGSLSLTFGF